MEIQIQKNVALRQFTTYHTGGPAKYFAAAKDWQTFFHLREFAKKEKMPFLVLGGGSNVLFADEGFPGMVVLNQMDKVAFHPQAVTAESGVHLMKLIALSAQRNLGGISALANVPGT
ncbi:FAD-binding protein, partial [Candidatus Peregrinibacteria bacterium]|nr:FAD-binding protein [Candidatus Peregrinibacteria bacterium]